MAGRSFQLDEARLTVVLRLWGFRCALEAKAVDRLGSVDEIRDGDTRSLASLLALEGGTPTAAVFLRGRSEILMVEQVESVLDVSEAQFLVLPALTHLERPVFRGVYQLGDDELLPVLDLEALLSGEAPDGA